MAAHNVVELRSKALGFNGDDRRAGLAILQHEAAVVVGLGLGLAGSEMIETDPGRGARDRLALLVGDTADDLQALAELGPAFALGKAAEAAKIIGMRDRDAHVGQVGRRTVPMPAPLSVGFQIGGEKTQFDSLGQVMGKWIEMSAPLIGWPFSSRTMPVTGVPGSIRSVSSAGSSKGVSSPRQK